MDIVVGPLFHLPQKPPLIFPINARYAFCSHNIFLFLCFRKINILEKIYNPKILLFVDFNDLYFIAVLGVLHSEFDCIQ